MSGLKLAAKEFVPSGAGSKSSRAPPSFPVADRLEGQWRLCVCAIGLDWGIEMGWVCGVHVGVQWYLLCVIGWGDWCGVM